MVFSHVVERTGNSINCRVEEDACRIHALRIDGDYSISYNRGCTRTAESLTAVCQSGWWPP